jgi:thermostable 8-oxoguanine DNA glycosylase
MLALALRNGYGHYRKTILLSNGATWIRNMKEVIFPDTQQILDFYHLCENVSNFAKDVFKKDETIYSPWSDRICVLLRDSRHEKALQEIKSLGKKLLSRSKHDIVRYIENNIDNIDYYSYIQKGYLIGSGPIESSNRTVVQKRMKQPGMRWNTETGQYIITLLTKLKSNLWEQDVVKAVYSHYGVTQVYNKR